MSAYELVRKYYPEHWSLERLIALRDAGKLTREEYEAVLNKEEKDARPEVQE